MKHVRRALLPALLILSTLVTSCGLPRATKEQIQSEKTKLHAAREQVKTSQSTVQADLAKSPDLFRGAAVAAEWPSRLRSAQSKVDQAEGDIRELEALSRRGGKEAERRALRLLSEERQWREDAVTEASSVTAATNRWMDFQKNPVGGISKMKSDYDSIESVDLAPLAASVGKAAHDWPGKSSDLTSRLSALQRIPESAKDQWSATGDARAAAVNGNTSGSHMNALIETDEKLAEEAAALTQGVTQLRGLSGQVYDAWDKVLDDLETAHRGNDVVYREKLKTVRTHFVDVAAKQTDVSSDVKWVDVSPAQYQAVENDLGMAISHKDAGLYDSEARNVAQPPGYAYIASPEVGSNQYGYWTHNSGGSFWTFLPQYLIMRELLWGRGYQPVVINDYRNYYQAQRSGRTYYGQETPTAAPKFGSHGTFTQQRYASSRYVQSGGYKSSSYSSPAAAPGAGASPRFGSNPSDSTQGRRFGRDSTAPAPQGRRFGNSGSGSGGGASRPAPSGRRFGSGGGSRSFGRRR